MGKFKDLTGMKFGRLTVIRKAKQRTKDNRIMWECQCECGGSKIVRGISLTRGDTKSCGCLDKEVHLKCNITHGQSKSILYKKYSGIKERCYNPNNPRYKWYGGKGISMCSEWLNSFEAFEQWAYTNGYELGLTIDRINVNGNYEPNNCRWVSQKVQANNKTNNRYITYNNETHTMAEWAEITGLGYYCVKGRLRMGWSIEKTFTTPKIKSYKNSNKTLDK